MEIIQNNKGRIKVCYLGYQCTKQIEKNDYIRWRCSRRCENWKGILKTTIRMDSPQILEKHNHPPSETLVKVAKCRAAMKAVSNVNWEKSGQIFVRSVASLSVDAYNALPSEDTCKRTIQNQKSAVFHLNHYV